LPHTVVAHFPHVKEKGPQVTSSHIGRSGQESHPKVMKRIIHLRKSLKQLRPFDDNMPELVVSEVVEVSGSEEVCIRHSYYKCLQTYMTIGQWFDAMAPCNHSNKVLCESSLNQGFAVNLLPTYHGEVQEQRWKPGYIAGKMV